MFLNILILCIFVLFECEAVPGHRNCSSCVVLPQCSEALDLINSNNARKSPVIREKFIKASCGMGTVDGKRLPKVCCSDFESIRSHEPEDEENFNIHENFGLLPQECGDIYSDRLLGGNFVRLFEFPWMTLIVYVNETTKDRKMYEFGCGGTIISSRYVLTSAYCVKGRDIAGVRVGDFDTRTRVDCQGEGPFRTCSNHLQDIRVKKSIVHEDYIETPHAQNDIALIRLTKPIDFSYKNAKPICLPIYETPNNVTLDGHVATVAGYQDLEAAHKLHKFIPIKLDEECREDHNDSGNNSETDNNICVSKMRENNYCMLAGSPLMLEAEYRESYRNVQYGIKSRHCGHAGPDVYTDVRKYVKWILDNIEE